jgi:PBP1b-binding outer membrane lipoprotein LpoB
MRTIAIILGLLFLTGCGNDVVKKPDNLIAKDKMTDIIYDLAILEAIRSQKPTVLEQNSINPNTYIYRKYHIDSLQFAKSNQYYASDIDGYKKIYEEVSKKLEAHKATTPTDPNAPQVQ